MSGADGKDAVLSEREARALALSMIDPETQALDEAHCSESEFCWIFAYNSKRFVQTRNIDDALFGNAPIIISKLDGSLVPSGTAEPVERYVARYERTQKKPWWRFW